MAITGVSFTAVARGKYVDLVVAATGATEVTIYREGFGTRWIMVRGADSGSIVTGVFQAFDWEAPQQQPIHYRAEITDGTDTVLADTDLVGEVNYGGDWLMPVGRVELGMNITVEYGGVARLERDVIRDMVQVVNRPSPMVVTWGRGMWSGSFSFLTLEDADRRRFLSIINYPVVMFAPRPGFGFDEPVFCSVGNVVEERPSGLGKEPARRWLVDLIQIARPPAHYVPPAPVETWQTRKDEVRTWQEIVDAPETWFVYAGFAP